LFIDPYKNVRAVFGVRWQDRESEADEALREVGGFTASREAQASSVARRNRPTLA